MDTTNDVVFVLYTGQHEGEIPRTAATTHVSVVPSIRRIKDHAFENCSHLVQVTTTCTMRSSSSLSLSSSETMLKTIGNSAFRNCKLLKSIQVPLLSSLETIGESAFAHCAEIEALHLPSTLATIGMCAFHSCDSLMEVGIAETQLKVLPYATFSKCHSLGSIKLPKTLKTIGKCAFFECQSLVDVQLFPQGLKTIATKAFSECKALCGIALPSSLETIGAEAFEFCTSLLCVELFFASSDSHQRVIRLGPHCFRGCEALVTISIPRLTMDSSVSIKDTFAGCNLLWTNNNNDDSIIEALRDRYEHLPVHGICYHSSHDSGAVDNLVEALNSLNVSEDDDDNLQDCYGMTPFHVAGTLVRGSTAMMQALLDTTTRYSSKTIVAHKDNHGRTMLDYLLMHTSNTAAVPLIQMVLERFVVNVIAGWSSSLGRERNLELSRRVEALALLVLQKNHDHYSSSMEKRRKLVKKVFEYAGYCTMVELTSLIELAMWKMKIMNNKVKLQVLQDSCKEEEEVDDPRSSCRYQCGANVAVENVMGFLWRRDIGKSDAGISMFPLCSFTAGDESLQYDQGGDREYYYFRYHNNMDTRSSIHGGRSTSRSPPSLSVST